MASIYWRNGWAWAKTKVKGVVRREPLGTRSKKEAKGRFETWLADIAKEREAKWTGVETSFADGVRTFTDADNVPERKVVIVDQALASKAFPAGNAVVKRILTRINTPEPEWVEIVGVVAHVRTTALAQPGREQLYFTDGFLGHGAVQRWALRVEEFWSLTH